QNDVLGSQVLASAYHYLSNKVQIRSTYLRNEFTNKESFGYVISSPETFNFNRFTTSPVQSNSSSDILRRDFLTGIYHRSDTTKPEDAGFEINLSKNKTEMPFSTDTLNWDLASYHA